MDKYLTYSVVERKDPQNPEVPGKFYAQTQARGSSLLLWSRCTVSAVSTDAGIIFISVVRERYAICVRWNG